MCTRLMDRITVSISENLALGNIMNEDNNNNVFTAKSRLAAFFLKL